MPNLPIKILIVDDHPAFRYGIRGLLETQTCFKVMGEAGSAKEALDYPEKTDIDLVLLDISMPDTDGIELASRFRTCYPNRKLFILMLTMRNENEYIRRARAAGANGYVVKDADPTEIFKTILGVAGGDPIFPKKFLPETLLTLSEKRVLWLSGHREYDTTRIASHMRISETTVHTHRHNIRQKLKSVLPEEETSNPNLLVILGVEYRQRCPEYAGEKIVIPDDFRPEALLTLSEKRVLWLSGHRKYDTPRIASRMGIVEPTVNTHRHNIWRELKAALPEAETSNPNLLVILGVEYRQRCPEYPAE